MDSSKEVLLPVTKVEGDYAETSPDEQLEEKAVTKLGSKCNMRRNTFPNLRLGTDFSQHLPLFTGNSEANFWTLPEEDQKSQVQLKPRWEERSHSVVAKSTYSFQNFTLEEIDSLVTTLGHPSSPETEDFSKKRCASAPSTPSSSKKQREENEENVEVKEEEKGGTLQKRKLNKDGKPRKQRSKQSTSKFRGVSRCSKDGRWQSRIRKGKKVIYLGRFKTEVEAALCYDKAALIHHKNKAVLNFSHYPLFFEEQQMQHRLSQFF